MIHTTVDRFVCDYFLSLYKIHYKLRFIAVLSPERPWCAGKCTRMSDTMCPTRQNNSAVDSQLPLSSSCINCIQFSKVSPMQFSVFANRQVKNRSQAATLSRTKCTLERPDNCVTFNLHRWGEYIRMGRHRQISRATGKPLKTNPAAPLLGRGRILVYTFFN